MDAQLRNLNKIFKKELVPPKNKKTRLDFKKAGIGLLIAALVVLILVIVPFEKISLKREINIVAQGSTRIVTDLGNISASIFPALIREKERVNFLFLGIGGESNPAPNLTDTIILINSTPKAENPIGISIPRDLLVKIPNKNYFTKINALYQYGGIENVKTIVNEITGLEIDYYLMLDLEAVKILIDKLGGIDINVEESIYDPKFPSAYDSYEIFSLEKGNQHLNGETALKYIRTRNQPEGDFSRIKRQQQVISALKGKILSLNFIWDFPKILGIWKTLQDHAQTNIGITDIKYAWNLAKKTSLDEIKFSTISPPLVVSGEQILGGEKAYILKPRLGLNNYSEIKNYINELIK